MPQTNSGSLDWKGWALGLLAAFGGGGATGVVTYFAATAGNPGVDLSVLPIVGASFVMGGVSGLALYLSQNSMPKYRTITVTTETISAPNTSSPMGLESSAIGTGAVRGSVMTPGMTKVTKVETYFEPLKEKE